MPAPGAGVLSRHDGRVAGPKKPAPQSKSCEFRNRNNRARSIQSETEPSAESRSSPRPPSRGDDFGFGPKCGSIGTDRAPAGLSTSDDVPERHCPVRPSVLHRRRITSHPVFGRYPCAAGRAPQNRPGKGIAKDLGNCINTATTAELPEWAPVQVAAGSRAAVSRRGLRRSRACARAGPDSRPAESRACLPESMPTTHRR